MSAPVRTTFQSGAMRRSALRNGYITGVGFLLAGVLFLALGDRAAASPFLVLAVLLLGGTPWAAATTLRRTSLSVDSSGLSVTKSKSLVHIRWQDVGSWDIASASRFAPRSVALQSLLVWPHASVGRPAQAPYKPLWSRWRGCWEICRILDTDGSVDEFEAAMNHFVPDKRKVVAG